PDGGAVETRVAAGLVERLDPAEAEPVPGSRRALVELGDPERQPAALQGDRREVAVERLRGQEGGPLAAPAPRVQLEERVEVGGERRGAGRLAEAQRVLAGELAFAPSDLAAEVRA